MAVTAARAPSEVAARGDNAERTERSGGARLRRSQTFSRSRGAIWSLASALLIVVVGACSDDKGSREEPDLTERTEWTPASVSVLRGNTYQVIAITENGEEQELVDTDPRPYAKFGELLEVFDGCNGLTARYAVDETGELTLSDQVGSLVGCVGTGSEQSGQIAAAFSQGSRVEVSGEKLRVSTPQNEVVFAKGSA